MIKRFIIDDAGSLVDMETGTFYDYLSEVVDLMNQQEEDKIEFKKQYLNLRHKIKKLSETI